MFSLRQQQDIFIFKRKKQSFIPKGGGKQSLLAFRHARSEFECVYDFAPIVNPRESATARQSDEINARQNNSP